MLRRIFGHKGLETCIVRILENRMLRRIFGHKGLETCILRSFTICALRQILLGLRGAGMYHVGEM
jgi:hypothetical protein